MSEHWQNWAGSVECSPQRIVTAENEDEAVAAVRAALADGLRVSVPGEGHSFMPVAATDGLLLKLDGLSGLIRSDDDAETVTLGAGTRIHDIGPLIRPKGYALANQGDVDVQAIAGALATGTHGTGRTLGNLSSRLESARLISAIGEIQVVSGDEADLLDALRVSLGMFGPLLDVTLSVLPAYRLHEKQWSAPFEECMEGLSDLIEANRHFEFFWTSVGDTCAMKTLNPVDADPDPLAEVEGEYIDHSDIVFPSERTAKFNEMEFSVPFEAGPDCLIAIRELMRTKHADVLWPTEYRTVSPDSGLISPQGGRETVAISVHQAAAIDPWPFFHDVEDIFRSHAGRPHWAKMHSHSADELAALYPRWTDFLALRREHDPEGAFLNDHLADIFT